MKLEEGMGVGATGPAERWRRRPALRGARGGEGRGPGGGAV